MIIININTTKCNLIGNIDISILNQIDLECSYMHQGHAYMARNTGSSWDGRVRLFKKNNTFPVGLLKRVCSIFNKNKVKYKIHDNRDSIKYGKSLSVDEKCKIVPRDYQILAKKKAVDSGSGIIKIATGGGKTAVISTLVAHYNIKTVIYVIGIELLYQMKSTLEYMYPDLEVGIVGDGICDIRQVNIATIWSAASAFNKKIEILDNDCTKDTNLANIDKKKVRDMVSEAELFILDECQYAAANTVQFLHENSINARHRFLFSASPWRDTGDDILIEAVGGPKVFDLSASTLIDRNFLVKPEIHFMNVPIMKNMPRNYQQVYQKYIVENDDRNEIIVNCVKKLVEAKKKVLVLVVRVSHGKLLMNLLKDKFKVEFLDGQKSTKDRLSSIEKMKSGELEVLVASKIFDQGVDIPQLDALVLAGSGKSTGRALQRIGRVIRKHPGKERAIVVEFFDNCKYLRDHSEVRMSVYKTEPSFIIKNPKKKK